MVVKRIFDISASFFGLLVLSPVILLIAVLIKVRMPGPVLFTQIRTGRDDKPFRILKFRTMIVDHEGTTISVKGESRITSLGAKLRKYKLDEIPELINVFLGDMSFVGPRPDVSEYMCKLVGEERLILKLRPGITSPASLKYANEEEILSKVNDPVKYYNDVIWPDKVRLNLNYYYDRSFLNDIWIILRTLIRI